jgi:DNA-binding SARP family transcriptional activator
MELLILGPLEVRVQRALVDLGRRKQRVVLALLACEANRPVPLERIVDELWPEDPPASARHSVEVYVSGLRRALGEGRVVRAGGGYQLRLEPGEFGRGAAGGAG